MMNSKKLYFLTLLLTTTNCFSQEKEHDITDVTKVTFLDPGIGYEKRIARLQSIYAQGFMSTSAYIGFSSSLGNTSYIYFDPALTIQYRYYYNAGKRQSKGKRTEMNSLNYISAISQTVFSKMRISNAHYVENNRRPINTFGVAWGFQRNYPKRFSLDLNLGVGYLFTKATWPDSAGRPLTGNVGEFTTIVHLTLGFWLNKMK